MPKNIRIGSALIYRIWLYRKRNWLTTIVQIILPPLILFAFISIHSTLYSKSEKVSNYTHFPKLSEDELYEKICTPPECKPAKGEKAIISYFPENNSTRQIIYHAQELLEYLPIEFRAIKDKDEAVKLSILDNLAQRNIFIGGIEFLKYPEIGQTNNALKLKSQLKRDQDGLKVSIRMAKFIPKHLLPDFFHADQQNAPENYWPFCGIQALIWRAYLNSLEDKLNEEFNLTLDTNISLQPFPYPPHQVYKRKDTSYDSIHFDDGKMEAIIPISLVLGLSLVVFSLVGPPIQEKENGFKRYLRLMGLPRWAYILSWILDSCLLYTIIVPIQVTLMFLNISPKLGPLIKQGNPFIWVSVLLIHTYSSISALAFLATFFNRGVMATYLCSTVWFMSYYFADLFLPSYIIQYNYASKVSFCLAPNGGLIWALNIMTLKEGGIQMNNFVYALEEDGISLLAVTLMLIFDIVLHYFLAIMSEYIQYNGIKRPLKMLWRKIYCKKSKRERKLLKDVESLGQEYFIKIVNITMWFKKLKAVDSISLNVLEGETIVILGFAGCGKSTLFNLLAGDYLPTEGTIYINNYDVRTRKRKVSRYVSVCLEKNYLCEDLRVKEHLMVVGKLKGLNHKSAKIMADQMLKSLEMSNYANRFPRDLFYFEKRKLSIALAFIGTSKLVLIDDPTKGLMDPDQSKIIWDFILSYRHEKTLLLSTSDIDEAYYLGNSIVLMSKGRFVNIGTKDQMEKAYGAGYHLKIEMENEKQPEIVEEFIKSHIPNAIFLEDKTKKLFDRASFLDRAPLNLNLSEEPPLPPPPPKTSDTSLNLISQIIENLPELLPELPEKIPSSQVIFNIVKEDVDKFPQLFKDLENETTRATSNILDFSLSFYSLENAHQEIDDYMELLENEVNLVQIESEKITTSLLLDEHFDKRITSPFLLLMHQFRALLIKRFHWCFGNWVIGSMQIILPLIILITTIRAVENSYKPTSESVIVKHAVENVYTLFPNARPIIRENDFSDTRYVEAYNDFFHKDVDNIGEKTFEDYFKSLDTKTPESIMQSKYPIGIDVEENAITAMFARNGFHSAPLSLSTALNAYLHLLMEQIKFTHRGTQFNLKYETESNPILYSNKRMLQVAQFSEESQIEAALTVSIMISFGFFILTSGFVVQPLAEKVLKLKELQLFNIKKFGGFIYWLSFFLWDLLINACMCFLILLCLKFIPKHRTFSDTEFQVHFMWFFFFSAYCSTLHSYIFSFVFIRSSTSYFAMVSLNQFGLFLFLLTLGITGSTGNLIRLIFKIFLPYNITSGFFSLIMTASENARCLLIPEIVKAAICEYNQTEIFANEIKIDKSCCEDTCWAKGDCKTSFPYLNWPEIFHEKEILTQDFTFMVYHILVCTSVLVLTELGFSQRIFIRKQKSKPSPYSNRASFDESIKAEAKSVENIVSNNNRDLKKKGTLYIDRISKEFSRREVLRNSTLIARPGEINSIVGPHNSGKTIFLEMVGKLRGITKGNAYFNKLQLGDSLFASNIGFTPEFLNVFNKVSGHQMLNLFGRLRAIPESELGLHTAKWERLLGFYERARHPCKVYPHNMLRRLSIAMALIGDPPILLFDDPTKDLDPISRYKFWSILQYLSKEENRIIILTSKKIAESTEKNCRIALLVNGEVKCIMHSEEMKIKYGGGFTLEVALKSDADVGFQIYSSLKSKIEESFTGIELMKEKHNALIYRVKNKELKWSFLFTVLEEIKKEFEEVIDEYMVYETTTNDVYQNFANKQRNYTRTDSTREIFCSTYC